MIRRALRCADSHRSMVQRPSKRVACVGPSYFKNQNNHDQLMRTSSSTTSVVSQSAAAQKQQVPYHLSPLWTKQHDVSLFGRHLCWMSFSEAAGHLSFLFLGLGFLETDLLPLRTYAVTGISCSIAFQYFRPQPLWIPIGWNAIFLGINAGMVALLLKEESDARQRDQEAATLYDSTFRESGLTAVDFMKIKAVSETNKRPAGEVLATENAKQGRLYLVMEGELQVAKHGIQIATVGPGEFAGEMSFLRHIRRECDGSPKGCDCVAAADVKVLPGGAKVTSWNFEELRELLSHHSSMSVCFHAALARAMTSKLVDTHNPAVMYRQLLQGVLVDGVVTTEEKEKLAKVRQSMKVDETGHAQELKSAGWSMEEFDQGYQDKPSSQTYETLARDVLRDGTVSDEGRAKLRAHRIANAVDTLHHMRVLRKLGWSLDDLEEGKKGAVPADAAARKPQPLRKVLSNSEQIERAFVPPVRPLKERKCSVPRGGAG